MKGGVFSGRTFASTRAPDPLNQGGGSNVMVHLAGGEIKLLGQKQLRGPFMNSCKGTG